VVLEWCYNGVTVVLQWCYGDVAVLLVWCHSYATVAYWLLASSNTCSACACRVCVCVISMHFSTNMTSFKRLGNTVIAL
jgi:hypothetical protein